jgi:hypothetical protein
MSPISNMSLNTYTVLIIPTVVASPSISGTDDAIAIMITESIAYTDINAMNNL